MSADTPPVFTFDHYEPGKTYGVKTFCVDEARVAQWRSVYPDDIDPADPGAMPGGMLAMIVLDAVLTHHAPRPPGGVHGGQTFDVKRMPRIGEVLATEVSCLDKEIRSGRKWVRAQTITRNEATGELLMTGIMTSLVAQ